MRVGKRNKRKAETLLHKLIKNAVEKRCINVRLFQIMKKKESKEKSLIIRAFNEINKGVYDPITNCLIGELANAFHIQYDVFNENRVEDENRVEAYNLEGSFVSDLNGDDEFSKWILSDVVQLDKKSRRELEKIKDLIFGVVTARKEYLKELRKVNNCFLLQRNSSSPSQDYFGYVEEVYRNVLKDLDGTAKKQTCKDMCGEFLSELTDKEEMSFEEYRQRRGDRNIMQELKDSMIFKNVYGAPPVNNSIYYDDILEKEVQRRERRQACINLCDNSEVRKCEYVK